MEAHMHLVTPGIHPVSVAFIFQDTRTQEVHYGVDVYVLSLCKFFELRRC